MKKLYVFILKSYIGPLILTFFIALFILVMQFLWKYVDDLVGKGLEWHIIAQLLFYASSTFVPLALPLAILLSSIMTFGNLGENYELVAMKAAGISLRTIMKPLVILSIAISIMAFLFSNYVLPIANLKFHSLLYDVRQKKLALNIKEGVFYNGIDGFTIRIGSKDQDKNIIRDVMIYNHTKRMGNTQVTIAKWGKMELAPDKSTLIFTLYDGYTYEEIINRKNYKITRPFQRIRFREEVKRFSGLDFGMNRTDENLFRKNYQMMNLAQLKTSKDSLMQELDIRRKRLVSSIDKKFGFYRQIDTLLLRNDTLPAGENSLTITDNTAVKSKDTADLHLPRILRLQTKAKRRTIMDFALQTTRTIENSIANNNNDFKKREERIRKHEIEWHRKFTLSIACLILFFIGAPLGAIIRKGGIGMPVVVSIFFFVIFHIISITGEKYARAGILQPYIAMWLASAVLLPIGIFLTYKATTDSPLLDADTWNKLFKRFRVKK